jgi:hypothetical protein
MEFPMAAVAGGFRRFARRAAAAPAQVPDVDGQAFATAEEPLLRAAECERGQKATMVGRLRSVETLPCAAGAPAVEAEFFDGTDEVRLVWIGQRRIPGIETGKEIAVRGRVGERGGHKVIFNPYYELLDNVR